MEAAEGSTYEFDVAVSFAGENREVVDEIVSRLKDAGITVFYDTDYQIAMWGEDLIEYLDQVYRLKARYVIMFVSRFYAEKMWTRHERRSALARALEQKDVYVLPIRIDDTVLEGLRPTVGYLDARLIGSDGIVNAILAKLTDTPSAQPGSITHVPRTEAERRQVLLARPLGWEFLYFAGQLLYERNNVESKYRDHELHYASAGREIIMNRDVGNSTNRLLYDAENIISYIDQRFSDAVSLARKLSDLVNDEVALERAFGAPGQEGDPERLAHLAKRWNSVYEEFMDWATSLRGASAPSEFRHLLELAARLADEPVQKYRRFVDEYVAQVDLVPATIDAGETLRISTSLIVSMPSRAMQDYQAELDRLRVQLQI